MNPYFSESQLMQAPVKRAAFSERMAYQMAEMSRLAYFKFEGGHTIVEFISETRKFIKDTDTITQLEHVAKMLIPDDQTNADLAKDTLKKILEEKGFDLVDTFNEYGTQAFLCEQREQKIAILSFRGTEPNITDIKTDVRVRLVDVKTEDGRTFEVHEGFWNGFKAIDVQLGKALKKVLGHQLFITGHSLGGALAAVATKVLASDTSGATYTYGAPPVGPAGFADDIKTPIYRIINHVDIVPRLPNPYLAHGSIILLKLVYWLSMSIGGPARALDRPGWSERLRAYLYDASRYRQAGYGSYLIGNSTAVKLRYNVSSFDRFGWWFKSLKHIFHGKTAMLSDHGIEQYSEKLAYWANARN